jgi:3-oxoacyl-[acyl-carrier protein] reductase
MDLGIAGKRVLVTGASRGLGRCIALDFAREGCQVAVVARRERELKEFVEELGGQAGGHSFCALDLLAEGSPGLAVSQLTEGTRPFDIVVHNLGGTLDVRDPLASADQWNLVWQLNVGIAIEINRMTIPHMQEQKWGRVVHISSVAAVDYRGAGPYAAAKAYLNAYVKTLGRSMAQSGVIVSALMPGSFVTEGGHWENVQNSNPSQINDFLRHHQAIGRLGTPGDISPFVLFMSSELARFAPGTLIPIDGGAM